VFGNRYEGKKVLITGHTGFKGTWLTSWLLKLGANIVGVSKDIPTSPSMFEDLNLIQNINSYECDVRDLNNFSRIVAKEKPDVIFHLAAQPIVSISYTDPIETVTSNVIGTMNMMEILRSVDWPCKAILITSDKSYDNVEWVWGYKETDSIGGKDVYSGSKGAAELIIKSYYHSFFAGNQHMVKLAVGRAGNVIGGGDWARDRIIVDIVRAWEKGTPVEVRCPSATRPWQHVLEPLSGYLALGAGLFITEDIDGEAFNFGPRAEQNRSVIELILSMQDFWGTTLDFTPYLVTEEIPFKESGLLKLNCDKALFSLGWDATLKYEETVKLTAEWYSNYFLQKIDLLDFTSKQIQEYESLAVKRMKSWTK